MIDERADQRRQKKLAAIEAKRKTDIDDAVRALVQHPQGRQYIYWILEIAGIGRNPYTGNALNTAFACGELNVGQRVQAHLIEVAPDAFLAMLKEKEEERLNAERPERDSDE